MWLLSKTNFSRANSNWIPLDKTAKIRLENEDYVGLSLFSLIKNFNEISDEPLNYNDMPEVTY